MFQAPFDSSCVALQYETGTKFFHRAVPEIHATIISVKNFIFTRKITRTNKCNIMPSTAFEGNTRFSRHVGLFSNVS